MSSDKTLSSEQNYSKNNDVSGRDNGFSDFNTLLPNIIVDPCEQNKERTYGQLYPP